MSPLQLSDMLLGLCGVFLTGAFWAWYRSVEKRLDGLSDLKYALREMRAASERFHRFFYRIHRADPNIGPYATDLLGEVEKKLEKAQVQEEEDAEE